ncbi:hypothetical protein K1719_017615 [Acacia pycnantha]|nr:hypothetical protein K1719_017615 [Acacia pycnantha]
MELTPINTASPATTATAHLDSLHTPTPPPIHPTNTTKSLSFTNGSLKHHHHPSPHPPPPAVVSYKECLKNHAASIGGHALDGCGEFMPSSASNPGDPRSLKCAACGCHRNFHRRDPQEPHSASPNFLSCFYPPLPPPPPPLAPRGLSPSTSPSSSPSSTSLSPLSSPSPPPVSHFPPPSYHTSTPHMLIAIGSAYSGPSDKQHHRSFMNSSAMKMPTTTEKESPGGRKRHRTKFSQEQKEKMLQFCEKLGWRMQKGDNRMIQDFCNEVGVSRGVFKVWMHNNKNTFRKKPEIGNTQTEKIINEGDDHNRGGGGGFDCDINDGDNHRNEGSCINLQVSVNGSSS